MFKKSNIPTDYLKTTWNGTMHILCAEDSLDHARILLAILKNAGFGVTHVQSGDEAYNWIKSNPAPDLLLTDVMMPGMSGFELVGRLKAENISIPTIFLTSRQREEDIVHGLESGALDYISKPFSPTLVCAKIKAAVRRSAA